MKIKRLIVILIANWNCLQRPQKRSRGNQLIYRRLINGQSTSTICDSHKHKQANKQTRTHIGLNIGLTHLQTVSRTELLACKLIYMYVQESINYAELNSAYNGPLFIVLL